MSVLLQKNKVYFNAKAEYAYADVVIMHEPSSELYYGVLHPHAALFDTYFNAVKAAKEHLEYRKLLKDNGADVYTIKELLLKNVVTTEGEAIEGVELEEFRSFARSCVRINSSSLDGLSVNEIESQHEYLNQVFKKMHPVDLVRTVLLQPNLILKKTPTNTFVTADYNANPVMNLYFSRDQLITTAKGIVVTNLNSPQREIESKILALCLKKLGIEPLLNLSKSNKKAFLEGGDFFALDNIVFIGQGMRTNNIAIKELMDTDVVGAKTVVVVKDKYHYQPQMHLDTYFNILDKDLVAISDERFNAEAGSEKELLIDIYEKSETGYQLKSTNISFKRYISTDLNLKVITISNEDQKKYGLNFLCIGPRSIISVKGQSREYVNKMKLHNVTIQWVDFENLKQGWGAAHCTTQVINRKYKK